MKGRYKVEPTRADVANGMYDCTTYVDAVLRRQGYNITPAISAQIKIATLTESEKTRIPDLLKDRPDPRLTGVVGALVDSGQGTLVKDCKNIQKGDLIQMWKLNKDKTVAEGHVIISESDSNGTKINTWGAHKSWGKVGSKSDDLSKWNHAWCVRPKKR